MENCLTSWETISYSINTLFHGRSVRRSVSRSVGRSVGRSFGRSVGRSDGRSVGRSVGRLFGWLSSGSMQRQRYINELKKWSTIDRPLTAPAHIVNWLVWEQTRTYVVRGQTIIARAAARSLRVLQFNTHSQSVLTLTHIVYVPLLT
jgi:hypothetical protein